ncbi:MAG: DUF1501 domain-containing protein [Planctomycetota bacterium]|nr:MAG: DUF1501 domain-containing protein [Planctomycetota bacterium]REJ92854.1 MAG: DUF1501 domain-containing protein [Planctomycetota bacterium]REK28881.1 MAG: DUF1501 domain-containing protein [Planctomycetota bacterium]REK39685.1 MAG: DUF1501 domain-containing protein [Planctomycetota bacterium]
MGVGSMALAWLMQEGSAQATPKKLPKDPVHFDLTPKAPHFAPRATAMISLFQHGGPSHVDLTDPKPELTRLSGTDYTGDVQYSFVNRASKALFGSPWKFAPHGECGTEISELLPHLAGIVDDVCLIRSMHTGANGHEVSIRYFHGGIPGVLGRPTLGSWLVYGLGSESQELPAYLVLTDPGGHPVDGVNNWSNGFMPPLFQGTVLRPKEPRILNLDAPPHLRGALQEQNLEFLRALNQRHLEQHPGEADLEARIASYELAASMQTAAREALDISQETQATQALYGLDQPETREYGARCLIARRLVERGVRFVQLFLGGQPWDNHNNIRTALPGVCKRTDRPAAALVTDLKQRGMLDSTIVHWGGEIGRLPVTENHGETASAGRDHNGQGYSIWFAGGGFRGGTAYGETDEVGHRAVTNVLTPNDIQATLMHQFGLDHKELTYLHGGRDQEITAGREARVVTDLLA